MKLHWVEIEHWRQHPSKRIDFDECATIIYGPNETGKSTVLEAMSRGLFDKSSSSAEAIKRIKPRTTSGNVTSTVRMELTISGTRYRVEKNFNLRKGTSLHRIAGDKLLLVSQDNDADERLIELLEAHLPSSRGSKPSNWGAFQWIWAPQDNRELPDSREGDPTTYLHLETGETPRVLITPKFQRVLGLTRSRWSNYFTGTGQSKRDSPIPNTEAQIQNLRKRASELNASIEKVDHDKRRLEELQQQLPIVEKKALETKRELEQARTEAVDFSSIESELEMSEGRVKESERDVRDVGNALKDLEKVAVEIDNLQDKEKKSRQHLAQLEALCEKLENQRQTIFQEVEALAMKVREAEELTRDARILWSISDTSAKISTLEKKVKRITDIEERVQSLRDKEIAVVPSSKEIEELRKCHAQIQALTESMSVRGLAIHVTPGNKGSLKVEVDGEKLRHGMLSATGTESVSVGAPGLGTVLVKAQLEQARDAKIDILRLKNSIAKTLNKFSVKSMDELQELDRVQNEISSNIEKLLAEARGIDESSVKELSSELRKLKTKLESYRANERAPIAVELNPADGDLGELVNKREKQEAKVRKDLDSARKRRDEANSELMEKKEELAKIRTEHGHYLGDLDNARTRERETIRRYGSIENQEKILAGARATLEKRRAEYEQVRKRYEDLEKGPVNRVKRLEKQIENQEQVLRQHRSSIDHLEGAIDTLSLEGAYSELADTESRIETLSERVDRERVRAEAYQLLKEELEQQYRSALSAVVGPIQEEVKHALSYVTGFLHGDVELNEYLFPTRLGERGFEDVFLEFTDASSGLKEVLALCVRLAVAKHLSGKDSQCLVLDDPFVHVSSDRSNRMIELINSAIEKHGLQVVVFTHRPMEFAGFNGKMVEIQAST